MNSVISYGFIIPNNKLIFEFECICLCLFAKNDVINHFQNNSLYLIIYEIVV